MLDNVFYMVAGEASGDILGSTIIKSLKKKYPQAVFKGIGGPLMQAQGFQSLYPMERLSVMGIVPILKRLPELLRMRAKLAKKIISDKPCCFIGIDAPEFNIGLEQRLKQQGLTTAHCVSPSVWAWREKRIYKIANSVSLMLCLFPFEQAFYQRHKIPCVCIGHPLADEIPLIADNDAARKNLKLDTAELTLALLPGSRGSEVKFLLGDFIQAAEKIAKKYPQAKFVLPCANQKIRLHIEKFLALNKTRMQLRLIDGQSREVMQAADVVLLASGTATLEAMLLKKPMLVAYKVSAFSYWIFKKLLKIKQFSLPNLLAGKPIVVELIQQDCHAENLFKHLCQLIDAGDNHQQIEQFTQLHQSLKLGGGDKAASAIAQLLDNKPENSHG